MPILVAQHQLRVKNERDFQYLQEDIAEFNLLRKKNAISLNEAERRKEKETMEAKFAARKLTNSSVRNPTKEQVRDALARTKDDGLLAGERDLTSELAAENCLLYTSRCV